MRGVALHDVRFCVVDFETTGCAATDEIVEVGALRSQGGEPDGTFQAFVRPSAELPLRIQRLTGIAPAMLADAAPIGAVLPSLLEFVRGCVFVAHNARFDYHFLARACDALDYERPEVTVVDTARLARRLVRHEIPDARLQTVAGLLGTRTSPNHRAFRDAAACLDVLHGLIERAAAYGIASLEELLELHAPGALPHLEKLRLIRSAPGLPGVYLLANAGGNVLRVGAAGDLRGELRSMFMTPRLTAGGCRLSEVAAVRALPCATLAEAEALRERVLLRIANRRTSGHTELVRDGAGVTTGVLKAPKRQRRAGRRAFSSTETGARSRRPE